MIGRYKTCDFEHSVLHLSGVEATSTYRFVLGGAYRILFTDHPLLASNA